jgi:hypothetical protein
VTEPYPLSPFGAAAQAASESLKRFTDAALCIFADQVVEDAALCLGCNKQKIRRALRCAKQGNPGYLTRFGIIVPQDTPADLVYPFALKIMADRFGGASLVNNPQRE